ncbi:MAG: HEAT repeat domain-containing protein [Gemmataceae bacterium]
MPELLTEVDRFRAWAKGYPEEQRSGEWECGYNFWGDIYDAVLEFTNVRPFESWSAVELETVLYAIARDNELEHLAGEIRRRHPDLLLKLAREAIRVGEKDNRWQLAEELGHISERAEAERLLLILARDEAEYVRRRSLKSLARHRSPAVEELAMEAWRRPDPAQEWARMMALDCLEMIDSSRLEPLLAEAEKDDRLYLSQFAKSMRATLSSE